MVRELMVTSMGELLRDLKSGVHDSYVGLGPAEETACLGAGVGGRAPAAAGPATPRPAMPAPPPPPADASEVIAENPPAGPSTWPTTRSEGRRHLRGRHHFRQKPRRGHPVLPSKSIDDDQEI
ncbi:MAG: hypothetical protein MZU95_15940 [Desulfomicrobium escambiense]|nr:hypothetical protein [Desulfomicrobium escambiense]